MDQYKWIKTSFLRLFILSVVIVAVIGLIIGKVVEANVYLEIAKWAVLAIVCGVMACVVFTPVIAILDHLRDQLYPKFGKKWFWSWIKNGFKVK